VEEYLSEKEQWEWIKAQVRENGPAVILAVAAVGAGVFGWRWWQAHLDAGRLEAGAKYTQMVQALDEGDRSRALVLFGELERGYAASPYTDQARLLAARLYVLGGELDRAAAELGAVVDRSKDRDLALVARLRLARVAAERVLSSHQPFRLNPMSSRERRIVHLALKEMPGVRTESVGLGEERQVVIHPAKAK